MDPNSKTHRHQSRIKREMYAARIHPFNSPPSSTGSHGTVSTTDEESTHNLSTFSFNPDGEGTRKLSEEINLPRRPTVGRSGRFGTQPAYKINTSALARAFPEWSSLASDSNHKGLDTATAPLANGEAKENIPPPSAHVVPVEQLDLKRKRTRSEMQPRVEDVSDTSSVLFRAPTGTAKVSSHRSRFAAAQAQAASGSHPPATKPAASDLLVSKIRAAQAANAKTTQSKKSPPKVADNLFVPVSFKPAMADRGSSPLMVRSSPNTAGRSFLLPTFDKHLLDWTSGTLKFSTMRNGVPVFVKHGKARSRLQQGANEHDTIDVIDVPKEDQEIFVSMDKLREEVKDLQEHDRMVQSEAEKLQLEVNHLQTELKKLKLRKSSDSAIGSDSDHSVGKALDAQKNSYDEKIAQLQERLDQASRQVGINDIHGAALTAERDEALHQASMARNRAKKLQSELQSSQKDLESTLKYRQENDKLGIENTGLRQDFEAIQKELGAVRDELQALRAEFQSLQKEKALIAQDHASLELNNETYFGENKSLKTKIAAQDKRIHDLENGIASRDHLIQQLQADVDRTTDVTGLHTTYAQLESAVETMKERIHQQDVGLHGKNHVIETKEAQIRALKKQNQALLQDNKRLGAEIRQMEQLWDVDRHKNIRLEQALNMQQSEYLKLFNDRHDACERTEKECKQKEADLKRKEAGLAQMETSLTRKMDRRTAAIKKMKQLTKEITSLSNSEIHNKSAKVTRIVEPLKSIDATRYTTSEQSAKSSAISVEDDPTVQIDLTQGSDFASVFTNDEIPQLKETLRHLRQNQQNVLEEASGAGNTVQTIDSDLPPLPGPILRRAKSDDLVTQNRNSKLAGILKKSSHDRQADDLTGRLSVVSVRSNQSDQTARSHRSVKSIASIEHARLDSRLHRRSQSDHGRFGAEQTAEQNMTSAFFVPDITLENERRRAAERPGPTLSKDARRVLDGVCTHKSHNCTVCARISGHTKMASSALANGSITKHTVRVQKPVAVTDRMPQPTGEYEEEPTMRPAMAPGKALAAVIKEMDDEIQHLQMEIARLNRKLFTLDKSKARRERERVSSQIQQLHRELDAKSAMMYKLHDVLEGQKMAGQEMTEEEMEVTIASICGTVKFDENHTVETRDGSWNGFD